jgi:hypothetical protein
MMMEDIPWQLGRAFSSSNANPAKLRQRCAFCFARRKVVNFNFFFLG